jgi:hypothetical protein
MRSILFIFLAVPFLTTAQINRSAREFAGEQVQEYITTKLFRDLTYRPVSFGDIKTYDDKKNKEIFWTIVHTFEVTDKPKTFDQKAATTKQYKFLFYLDDKMKVIRADSYFVY